VFGQDDAQAQSSWQPTHKEEEEDEGEDEAIFPSDFQLPIQLLDDERLPLHKADDEVLQSVRKRTAKA
jgi:hypothetical protein